jgi:flagellar hook-length control protein FliK
MTQIEARTHSAQSQTALSTAPGTRESGSADLEQRRLVFLTALDRTTRAFSSGLGLDIDAQQSRRAAQVSPLGPVVSGQLAPTLTDAPRYTAASEMTASSLRDREASFSLSTSTADRLEQTIPSTDESTADVGLRRESMAEQIESAAATEAGNESSQAATRDTERSEPFHNEQSEDAAAVSRDGQSSVDRHQGEESTASLRSPEAAPIPASATPSGSPTVNGTTLSDQGQVRGVAAPARVTPAAPVPGGGQGGQNGTPNGGIGSGAGRPSATGTSARAEQSSNGQPNVRMVPLEEQALLRNVTRGLNAAVLQKGGSLTMRLRPAALGQLRIEMQVQGNHVNAVLHAESDQVQRLLGDQIASLRSALEARGLTVGRLDVQPLNAPAGGSATPTGSEADPGFAHGDAAHDAGQGRGQNTTDDSSGRQGGGPASWQDENPSPAAESAGPGSYTETSSSLNVIA